MTVTGVDDDLIDGTITSTTTISVDDANSDDNFDAVADQTVSVSTTDDDVAGSRFLNLMDPQQLLKPVIPTPSPLSLTHNHHPTLFFQSLHLTQVKQP